MSEQIRLANEAHEDNKKKRIFLLLLLLLLLTLGGLFGWYFSQGETGGVIVGNFPGLADAEQLTADELLALIQDELEEGMTRMTVFPEIFIGEDGLTGQMWVQNDPENQVGQQAIVRDENGVVLFESGLILPGYQINRITLNEALPSGNHPAIIAIEFYDLVEEELLSANTIDAVIRVE